MGNFDRNRGSRNYRDNRDHRSDQKEMFGAVCDDCGKNCEVPFRPRGDKPIFCSNCFEHKEGGNRNRDDRGRGRFDRRDSAPRDFHQRSDNHNSFGGNNYRNEQKSDNNEQVIKELKSLNKKLEEITKKLGRVEEVIAPSIKVQLPKEDNQTPVPTENLADKEPSEIEELNE